MSSKKFLTDKECAKIMGVKPSFIKRRRYSGEIEWHKFGKGRGGRVFILEKNFWDFIDRHKQLDKLTG